MKYQTQPSVPGMPGNNQYFQFDGQAGLASLNQVRGPEIKTPTHYGTQSPAGNASVIRPEDQRITIIPKLNPEVRNQSTENFIRQSYVPQQNVPVAPYQPGSFGMTGGIGNAAWCD